MTINILAVKAIVEKPTFYVKYFRQRLLSLVNMGLHVAIIRLRPLIHEGSRENRMYKVKTTLLLCHFHFRVPKPLTFKKRLNANLTFVVEMRFIQHENKYIIILVSIGHLHDDLFLLLRPEFTSFFSFIYKSGNPSEVKITKALICTRKECTEGFW